jgi:hypothetical protein
MSASRMLLNVRCRSRVYVFGPLDLISIATRRKA